MVNLVENQDYATFLNDIILNKEELLKSNITAATLIYNIYNFLPDEMITPELEEAGKFPFKDGQNVKFAGIIKKIFGQVNLKIYSML